MTGNSSGKPHAALPAGSAKGYKAYLPSTWEGHTDMLCDLYEIGEAARDKSYALGFNEAQARKIERTVVLGLREKLLKWYA